MNTLKQLLANQHNTTHPLPLFSKLRQIKQHQRQGQLCGATLIDYEFSDVEDQEDAFIRQIKSRLQRFKEEKALQVVNRHEKTQESIQSIVKLLKNQFKYEALCIIDSKYKVSASTLSINKQSASTLPNSSYKHQIQTPAFDLPSATSKSSQNIHQFTLGQGHNKSNESIRSKQESLSLVSEFKIGGRQAASRKIKNRIMNTASSTS